MGKKNNRQDPQQQMQQMTEELKNEGYVESIYYV
jgi:hypothetical protein